MYRTLILAFLLAAPFGVALGYAATALLSPHTAAAAFNGFLALIILGALGTVLSLRPIRGRSIPKASAYPSAALPA